MQKKYVAWVLAGVLVLSSTYYLFNPEVSITERDYVEAFELPEEVEIENGYILLNGFSEKPKNIRWMDESHVIFSSDHPNYGQSTFDFDVEELRLEVALQENDANASAASINELTNYGLYEVSENGGKLLYYDEERKSLIAKNLVTGFERVIEHEMTASLLENFHEWVELSPDGGFLYIYEPGEVYSDATITIYGADSGRLYGENIKGTSPTWSEDSKKLSFFYTGKNDNVFLQDTLLGIFSLRNKNISYVDTINTEAIIGEDVVWAFENSELVYLEKVTYFEEVKVEDASEGKKDLPSEAEAIGEEMAGDSKSLPSEVESLNADILELVEGEENVPEIQLIEKSKVILNRVDVKTGEMMESELKSDIGQMADIELAYDSGKLLIYNTSNNVLGIVEDQHDIVYYEGLGRFQSEDAMYYANGHGVFFVQNGDVKCYGHDALTTLINDGDAVYDLSFNEEESHLLISYEKGGIVKMKIVNIS